MKVCKDHMSQKCYNDGTVKSLEKQHKVASQGDTYLVK